MDKKIFLLVFAFFAVLIVVIGITQAPNFGSDADAGGFGISPPYVRHLDLSPGDMFIKSITIMRSSKDSSNSIIEVVVDAPEIEDWITIDPGKSINFAAGDGRTSMRVNVNVPEDAINGNYKGYIYVTQKTARKRPGVGIGLGARVDVDLTVKNGREKPVVKEYKVLETKDSDLVNRLKGYFIIKVEDNGKVYFLSEDSKLYFLSDQQDARYIIEKNGLGINNTNLNKIPLNLYSSIDVDTDGDGLSDTFEIAISSNRFLEDTDSDGFNDKHEVENGFSPNLDETYEIDKNFSDKNKGKIFLQVESKGEAWYVNPKDSERYFLGGSDSALYMMRDLSLGISNENFDKLLIK